MVVPSARNTTKEWNELLRSGDEQLLPLPFNCNNQMKNTGIVLIVIGIIMMFVTGFNYVTRENVVDAGPLQINADKNHPVEWSPIVGGVLIVAGTVVLLSGKKS